MKRTKALLSFCLALCLICFAMVAPGQIPVAQAAGSLTISGLSADPSSLSDSGTVNVSGKLNNGTSKDIESVLIECGGVQLEVNETIKAGASKSFTLKNVSISKGQLDQNITVSATWPEGSSTGTFKVASKQETISVAFTRTASSKTVQKGDTVKLTYNIKNTGTATLTGLTLTDSCVQGTIASGVTLAAGENKQYTSTVKVNSTVSSVPKITYTAGGSTKSKSLDALKITIADAKLSMTATPNKTEVNAGDKVTFTIKLQNDSAVAISGIKVMDNSGTVIRSSANLAATTGSTPKVLTITHEMTIDAAQSVSFSASFTANGQTQTAHTDPIDIQIAGAVDPNVSPLEISVSADPAAPTFPGDVTFTATVKNASAVALQNVVVSEAQLGQLGTVSSLAAGASQTFTKTVTVSTAGQYAFSATANDASGAAVKAASASLSLNAAVASPTPEPESGGNIINTLFIVMIVIVVLIVLSGIALVVLMVQERRAKKNGKGSKGPKGPGGSGPSGRRPRSEDAEVPAQRRRRPVAEEDRIRRRPPAQREGSRIQSGVETAGVSRASAQRGGERRTYALDPSEDMPRGSEPGDIPDDDGLDLFGVDETHSTLSSAPTFGARASQQPDASADSPDFGISWATGTAAAGATSTDWTDVPRDDEFDESPRRQVRYEDDEFDEVPRRRTRYEDDGFDETPRRRTRYEDDGFDETPRRRPRYEDDGFDEAPRRRVRYEDDALGELPRTRRARTSEEDHLAPRRRPRTDVSDSRKRRPRR